MTKPTFTATHIAVIGPDDHGEKRPVLWRYKAAMPRFHAVEDANGTLLLVAERKLTALEEAETP